MMRTRMRWGPAGRLAVAAVVGAVTVAVGPGRQPADSGSSALSMTVTFVAGVALAFAGVIASLAARTRRIGALAEVAALAWLAPLWAAWVGLPAVVRSLAVPATLFTLPLIAHAVVAYHGRVRSWTRRTLVAFGYGGAGLAALGLALFRDPFYDPHATCDVSCPDNVFLVDSVPELVRGIDRADRWLTVTVAAALAAICTRRVVTASKPLRRILTPVDGPAVLLACALAAQAMLPTHNSLEDPSPIANLMSVIAAAAAGLLAVGFVWGASRPTLERRAAARILSSLGEAPAPGLLEAALGRAVGDPGLRITYRLPDSGIHIDANGFPVPEPTDSPTREVTVLVRGEDDVAFVTHATGLDLQPALGAAVRLALENERLRAQRLAQLEDLKGSRARIVEAGDAQRKRLERDLHDGAQQLLLAALYEIQLARAAAEDAGHAAADSALTAVLHQTQTTLEELRELAHGIYPAILSEAGLAAALESLADTAVVRLQTEGVLDVRYSSSTETAAYLLVAEAVEDAAARGADDVVVSASPVAERLVIGLSDDGSDRTFATVGTADRIVALGGTIHVDATAIRAELPCG